MPRTPSQYKRNPRCGTVSGIMKLAAPTPPKCGCCGVAAGKKLQENAMGIRVRSKASAAAVGLAALVTAVAMAGNASAATLGAVDTFQDGSTNNWVVGPASPIPPVNMASGGPAGASDRYLQLTSTGGNGPGSRLVSFNQSQWAGNFVSAGITSVEMDLINLGTTTLNLRFEVKSTTLAGLYAAYTADAFTLQPGSGWQHAVFTLLPATMVGDAANALVAVTEVRLFHGPAEEAPVVGKLGVDNIAAVPEPSAALLGLAGLGVLAAAARRRRTQY
jgi:hypothetical protein